MRGELTHPEARHRPDSRIAAFFGRHIPTRSGSSPASSAGSNWPPLYVLLPIGVSFHTFQSMGYTIVGFRRESHPIRNARDYQLFVTFFPLLVAGPIERATRLLLQVLKDRGVEKQDVAVGLKLMLLGFFKKVVVADNLAPIVDLVYSTSRDELVSALSLLGLMLLPCKYTVNFQATSMLQEV